MIPREAWALLRVVDAAPILLYFWYKNYRRYFMNRIDRSHPRQPPFRAEREKQDLFEADPHERPVLEWLRVERYRAVDSRPTGCAAGAA